MSVSCSIDIKLVKYINPLRYEYNIPAIVILKKLLNFGWNPNTNGEMCYLPIGDKDDYAWTSSSFNFEHLTEIVEKKETLNEIIGINMWWKDTGIGGSFLFYKEHRLHGQLSLSLHADRPILFELSNWHKVTDVNWYLTKLLPAFKDGDLAIEYFCYDEHK